MKKAIIYCSLAILLASCANNEPKVKGSGTGEADTTAMADLPYTASYSSQWSPDVSDADLKMVLMSYKDWETNNMAGLGKSLGDTVTFDMSTGESFKKSNADLIKMWTGHRDSLSSVKIRMDAWHKMYSTDKKESYVVTWYDETDTYKDGRVDSASYHDINQIKDGKIVWYAQYKRPKK